MPRPRLRALVLAAGRGERLRPLTATLPKPLLPVAGRPLVVRTLEALRRAGCEAAALNLHHLGDAIRETLGESFRGMPLVYSEESELLGTGGAILPLRDFLAGAQTAVVVNGDSLCRWPVRELVERRLQRGAAAAVLLRRAIDPRPFGGGVALEGDRVLAFRPGSLAWAAARRRALFAGAQAIDPALLSRLPGGPSDLVDALYHPLLAEGAEIVALETARLWHDLGTPARYLDGVLDATFRGSSKAGRALAGAELGDGAALRRALVESGAVVGAGARLERALVLGDTRIGANAVVRDAIVGPGVEVDAGERIERQLLTRGPSDTRVATPIDR